MITRPLSAKQAKSAFTQEEMRILFTAAKNGDTLEDVKPKLPKRNEKAIVHKLNRMGFGVAKGVIYTPKRDM